MTINEPTPTIRPSTKPPTTPPPDSNTWPRWANLVLGAWLFVSAFIWPHTYYSMTNSWAVGLAIVVISIVAMYVSWARWLNTLIAIYLFVSTFAVGHVTAGTIWNNAIVAVLVFLISLMPGGLRPSIGQPRRVARA